jgi:hypothetical protein
MIMLLRAKIRKILLIKIKLLEIQKYLKKSIELKDEISKFNNEIVNITSQGGSFMDTKIDDKFREVRKFFKQLETLNLDYKVEPQKNSSINFTGSIEVSANPIYEALVRTQCGYSNNPKPTRSAPKSASWHSNPQQTLFNWGYHRTANYATGREYGIYDYTRNITWNSWLCKFNSFRDHAGIDKDQWGNKSNTLREQKYWGYTPNGECNPEIHSYIWPYPEWPAYCKWWHDRN